MSKLLHPLYLVASLCVGAVAFAQAPVVNWETPHVHPLDMTPDGARLLAVNTAGGRLEVFDLTSGTPVLQASIPVGLDPVSVRARNDDEAWVVNRVSDTVSIVDLSTRNVVATLDTDDEPADVVFAGTPRRAWVSCSGTNRLLLFDPGAPGPPLDSVELAAVDPRAMAVSSDGSEVYVAVFHSGNGSTVLGGGFTMAGAFPPNVVSHPSGPYGGQNPPPNSGASFAPSVNPALPTPPPVSLIVKRDAAGVWMDDNGADWTSFVSGALASLSGRPVGWQLTDHDLAVVDTASLSVQYADRLMNLCMAIGRNPATGNVTVVGTDATNEIRFEPNLKGRFLRVLMARVDPAGPSTAGIVDLNPHLTYATGTTAQSERDRSIGDPRGVAWNAAGTRAYVTGMGSNNVVVVDATGNRAGIADTIEVGEGPTGIAVDAARNRLYVLNRFEGSVSVVSTQTEVETSRVGFYDPTPTVVRAGRRHLYDTHETSGLGIASCASCHIDARLDRLAWDLGDPSGSMKSVSGQNLAAGVPLLAGGFEDFHPMKGPMVTQTLQDIIGKEPHHWRGDRNGIEQFNPAFQSLLGDDEQLTPGEMQEFEDFLATIRFPPNPYRRFDNGLPTSLSLEGHFTTGAFGPAGQQLPNGNARNGLALFRPPNLLALGTVACVTCHTLPAGIGTDTTLVGASLQPIPPGPNGEHHHALVSLDGTTNVSMKVPQLRNLRRKVGFDMTQATNTTGFGFLHDGSVDSLARFVSEPIFTTSNDQQVADLIAFLLSFSGSDLPQGSSTNLLEPPGTASLDTHAAVGTQTTLVDGASPPAAQVGLIDEMIGLSDAGAVGLIVKGRNAGLARGYTYVGGDQFQSDRLAEVVSRSTLQGAAGAQNELTFTVVVAGTEQRLGVDYDGDGFFDRDELDAGSDPADPNSVPCSASAPATPTGLVATSVTRFVVSLAWTDQATNEERYFVERRRPGEGFKTIANLAAGVQAYTDVGVDCSSSYEYRVLAANCAGATPSSILVTKTRSCRKLRYLPLEER